MAYHFFLLKMEGLNSQIKIYYDADLITHLTASSSTFLMVI